MIPFLEPMLYLDCQRETPLRFCEKCGGECYPPSGICARCQEVAP